MEGENSSKIIVRNLVNVSTYPQKNNNKYIKIKINIKTTGGMVQVVNHLPNTGKALGSIWASFSEIYSAL
jgi:hypothetical protein